MATQRAEQRAEQMAGQQATQRAARDCAMFDIMEEAPGPTPNAVGDGDSDTEVKELIVMPTGPSGPSAVTTQTPVANAPSASR